MHMRHRWSNWSEPELTADRFTNSPRLVQTRTCAKCGLIRQIVVGVPPVADERVAPNLKKEQ